MKKKKNSDSKEKIHVTMEELVNSVSNVVFSNLKIHLEKKLSELNYLFEELEDVRTNTATLSTLLHHKKIIGEEEYRDCFNQMKASFGEVKSDGTMDGEIICTIYNK